MTSSPPPSEREAQTTAVVAFVNAKGRTSAVELGEHLGISKWKAAELARKAVERGLIRSTRGIAAGYYPLGTVEQAAA